MKGVNIGGVNINNLRYADDIALLAEGPMFLQALLTAVNEKGKPYGMEMNIIKTKSMVISRKKPVSNISISIEGKPTQQVDRMVYLGYMATEDGKYDKEIKRRIWIARTAFESMAKILTSRNIGIELRSRIAKCYIWSTLLYGAETWTLTKVTSDKLEPLEMWLYRRKLGISWKEHKTNGEVWTYNIKEWTKISYNDCIRVAQDRELLRSCWLRLAHNDDECRYKYITIYIYIYVRL